MGIVIAKFSEPSAMSQEERLITLKETAEILSISLRTVMRLVADGSLPSVLIGRRRLIRREALRAWLAGREFRAAA